MNKFKAINLKIIRDIVVMTVLVIIQLSFIDGLPGWFNSINLILISFVFILGLSDYKKTLWLAIFAGFLLDIFSHFLFGTYLASLVLTIMAINFLLNDYFTNRSVHSFLALTFLATLIYNIVFFSTNYVSSKIFLDFQLLQRSYMSTASLLGKEIFMNLIGTLVAFYLLNSTPYLKNRMKAVFLHRY